MVLEPYGRRRERRRALPRRVVYGAALVVAFVLGIAVARALDEAPQPGGVVTSVRTLTPLPQQAPTRTVTLTVTVTEP
jgi:hypothetical protein